MAKKITIACLLTMAAAIGAGCGASVEPTCIPNCQGKQCGADGCGGVCGSGCAIGSSCQFETGQCIPDCLPNCYGKMCGPDGCGGTCPPGCPADQPCTAEGLCQTAECPTGLVKCGDGCVDTTTDAAHCGGCGQPCPTGQGCSGSQCTAQPCTQGSCPPGSTCDPVEGVCKAGCSTDADCPPYHTCDDATRSCLCSADAIPYDDQCYGWAKVSFQVPGSQYQVSFAIDDSDPAGVVIPHIIGYGQKLSYARLDGSTLTDQTDIESENVYHPRIAVDSTGTPHVAFYVGSFMNGVLNFASPTVAGGSWDVSVVDEGTFDSFTGIGLAIDSSDRAHLVFVDLTYTKVRYALQSGLTWEFSTVSERQLYSMSLDIAIGRDDVPHVAFNTSDPWEPPDLNHGRKGGSSWLLDIVDSIPWDDAGPDYYGVSVAVSPQNQPSVTYTIDESSPNDQGLRLARYAGSSWQVSTVRLATGSTLTTSNLAIDSKGQPHVCYTTYKTDAWGSGEWNLHYAYLSGDSWKTFDVADNTFLGEDFFALDRRDIPHIVYFDRGENKAVYATLDLSEAQ